MLARNLFPRTTGLVLCAVFLAILSVRDGNAQTTAFTYQGLLTSSSANANGSYDFTFTLFDALNAGNQIGTVSKTGITVTNGVFTVSLDFGASAFPGANRFLEIAAKKSTDSTFITLTPRQQISPNPYAITAQNATNATQLGGVTASQYVTTTNGPTNFIQNQSASTQTANFNISGNGTAGGNLSGNNVGIGTATPNFRLHIVDSNTPSIRVDGSSTIGAWLQLNSTAPGGHIWGLVSSSTGNGEGAGNLVINDFTGGGHVTVDSDLIASNITANGSVTGTQYNIGANRVLGVGGTSNLFVGLSAGASNGSSSINNSFVGVNAGQKNTTGNSNSYLGFGAGANNLSGVNNIAVGVNAGTANTASHNTFIGAGAGQSNNAGLQNTFIGEFAGQNNTTGLQSVFLGANSGASNTTENSNTFLGYNTNGTAGIFNATAIGSNAKVTSSNAVVLGSLTDSNNATTDTFVGIGVTSPLVKLHVVESSGNTFRVMRVEGASTLGVWSELVNNSTGGHDWAIISAGSGNIEGTGNLVITDQTSTSSKVVINNPLSVPSCTGCTNSSSDRNVKSNFAPVNGQTVLEKLVGIPIQSWNYNSDPATLRHIGPMAQDFYAAFGVGSDDKHINLLDEGGVAFAAIQELYKSNQAKDQQINDLTKRIEALEHAIEKLTKQQQ